MPVPVPVPGPVPPSARLRWQSRAVLLLVVPAAAIYAFLASLGVTGRTLWTVAAVGIGLAAAVLAARAATTGAALLGALLAYCVGITPAWPHSALWPLFATLLLTLGSSRLGRARKQRMALAEAHGRDAAQVAANLGIAALCGILIASQGDLAAQTAMTAAFAETVADTLASELGQLVRAQPRMLLGGQRVAHGTDGAISLPGTLAGLGGAAVLVLLASWAFALPPGAALAAFAAAAVGLFVDSLVGQLAEQRGLLNNDAVNFLSNACAALAALVLVRAF